MQSVAAAVLVFFAVAFTGRSVSATAQHAELPPPLSGLEFGMTQAEASSILPEAKLLQTGVDFGRLKGRLVVQRMEAFGSIFRIYLQFDHANTLRQILLERRHAEATRNSARNIRHNLFATFGAPEESCLPQRATPAAARVTWRKAQWSLHLVGFDDIGLGIRTKDADRSDPL